MKVIGLMSGTSVDGVDTALVEISGHRENLDVTLLAAETYPYPEWLQSEILAVCAGKALTMAEFCELDDAIAQQFAKSAQTLEKETATTAELIGSHGQTLFHRPPQENLGYSLQLGRGAMIAHLTQCPTVSNFRAADIAENGQGAPLVPKVDACLLSHPTQTRCVQNIGGISNVTYLPPRSQPDWEHKIWGWDNGPGNSLLDLAVQHLSNGEKRYDEDGQWAAQGTPNLELLQQWLEADFFQQPPPKSTGRELFGADYFEQVWQQAQDYDLSAADFLATLTELTVSAIAQDYRRFLPQLPETILLCGGGSRNHYLKQRLQQILPQIEVTTTDVVGLDSHAKEAIAFAVLAYWRYCDQFPSNLPTVTGAKKAVALGEIAQP
ncbi:MAG: anhydro-N-acetylmuramic acid kinase [Halothece sp. Uz-M2-17]|nr:anhydro-N-acetylmuramic acid kinase [Halothece sp. Uz-M2-17]